MHEMPSPESFSSGARCHASCLKDCPSSWASVRTMRCCKVRRKSRTTAMSTVLSMLVSKQSSKYLKSYPQIVHQGRQLRNLCKTSEARNADADSTLVRQGGMTQHQGFCRGSLREPQFIKLCMVMMLGFLRHL